MPVQPSRRALDFMRCVLPEQRRSFRVHLPIRAIAVFPHLGVEPQSAFLRDVNMLGAFFYCKQKPSIGQGARLEFALPGQDEIKAICEGLIVRVEEFGLDGAIGVAVEFARYELTRPLKLEPVRREPESTPFIGWTVDMVERMFENSEKRGHRSPKCGHAA